MPEQIIYLDNNASTYLHPEVVETMQTAISLHYGNPSSPHSLGVATRKMLEEAREKVATLINAYSENIIFTSSGSEANNQAILSGINSKIKRIITSTVEHSSIKFLCEKLQTEGISVDFVPVNRDGLINLENLESLLQNDPAFVSIQWVNNETGVIQPIKQIAEICKKHECLFHTDAAQALGKINIDLSEFKPDYLTLTAHKINGPQGVGALYTNDVSLLKPIIVSGTEEQEKRGGTENFFGIVGFGKASELRYNNFETDVRIMKRNLDLFEKNILNELPNIKINGDIIRRVCNTTNIQFCGIDGTAMMGQLDNEDIICSQTSACLSQIPEPSFVLTSMGLNEEEAFSSLRFSFSSMNTEEEAIIAAKKVIKIYKKLETLF